MNPVFSFFFRFSSSTRRYSPQAMITSSSQQSIPTTIKSGSRTLQNRRSVKLLDYSSDISGYHADFHEGYGTVGAGQGRGMACVINERHGRVTACARHAKCESAFTVYERDD